MRKHRHFFYVAGFFDDDVVYTNINLESKLIENMITSCVHAFKWTPHYCKRLYLDDIGVYSLKYWHDDAKKIEESLNSDK